jgi:putative spermidine/putrescine transport system permease protein
MRHRATVLLLLPAALLLTLFLLLPLAQMAGMSLNGLNGQASGGHWSLQAYAELFSQPGFRVTLLNTLLESAAITAACLLLGIPVAVLLARAPATVQPWLLLLVTVPYLASVLIRSYAWVVLLSPRGVVNQALLALAIIDAPLHLAYTRPGALLAMVQVQLPLIVLSVYAVLQRLDPLQRRAARALGADPITVFVTVTLPLSMPGIAAGAILVFTSSLGFYVTPALLGAPGDYMLAQAIEARVNTANDYAGAAAQAMTLLALIVVVALLFRRSLAFAMGIERPAAADRAPRGGGPTWPGWLVAPLAPARWWVGGGVAVATLLLLVLPVLILLPLAFSDAPYLTFPPPGFSLRWFRDYAGDPDWLASTAFSLAIAVTAGAVALIAGATCGLAASRLGHRGQTAVIALAILPLVVSHMVIAVAVFFTSARLHLVGHPLAFVGTYALLGLPYVVLIISAALRRFDPLLLRAAASLGARAVPAAFTVLLPLLAPAIAGAFAFAFLAAFDDVTIALFLSTPTAEPLPMRIWDSMRESLTPRAAAVAIALYAAAGLLWLLLTAARRAPHMFRRTPA